MSLMRLAWPLGMVALVALGCHGGGTGSTGSGGAGGGTATASTSGSSSSSSGAGAGGAATSSTSGASSSSSSGAGGSGGGAFVPSGFACSGASHGMPDVVAITQPDCSVGVGCHVAMKSGPMLYSQFVGRLSEECSEGNGRLMISPGDPEHSYVINKITDKNLCAGVRMPNGKAPLTAAEIQVIYDWICEGAPMQ